MDDKFLDSLSSIINQNNAIEPELYEKYDVKRGLRHKNGTGVLVGLTKIGSVHGYKIEDDKKIPEEGRLYYRDYELKKLAAVLKIEDRFSFEKTMFLLLFGKIPTSSELNLFISSLNEFQNLPEEFTENFLLRKPSIDLMNQLQRAVLCLYTIDDNPDDISLNNLISQALSIIGKFPSILTYSYNAYRHKHFNDSLVIHNPRADLSIAENILYMFRHNNDFSRIESSTLDLLLVIHAEHGGGNNSTFTSHVVSSTGTDTYSAISAAIGSLKGPKHGGANYMVSKMINDIKENVGYSDQKKLKEYLRKILNQEAFDKSGLIYGMGHAIYTLSDPRAELLKEKAEELAKAKGKTEEFYLYKNIEKISKEVFKEIRGEDFEICANVDFYSGFVYKLLNIPEIMFTPLFATSRIASWNAHRIEQIVFDKKIIRPAYKAIDAEGNLL
jgi:citrate synthase